MPRKLVQWPIHAFSYCYVMYLLDWDGGNWTSLIITDTYGLSQTCTFPVLPEPNKTYKSFFVYFASSMVLTFVMHMMIIVYIFIIFVGGDFLVTEDIEALTVFVTGMLFLCMTITVRAVLTNLFVGIFSQKEAAG